MIRRTRSETTTEPAGDDARAAGPLDTLMVFGEGRLTSRAIGDELVIGRGNESTLVIDHPQFSRRHAVVRRRGDLLSVQDLGSTNGIVVAGLEVRGGEPRDLAPGDSFAIGPYTFFAVSAQRSDVRSLTGVERLRVDDPTPDGVPSLVRELAASDVSILLRGETGVGKEVLAATLHTLSNRQGPLVRINCAALSPTLLESELFGHERGAFTGALAAKVGLLEAASGGTVFLDEIGELPLDTQAKLLRAVEQREVLRLGSVKPVAIDVRFIAATNRDLVVEVEAGRFRRDLYFRLDGVTLYIPPLRERSNAIGALALHFLEEACRRAGRPQARLGADVLEALKAHAWPGNVRELRAVIERAVLLARGGDPAVRHLAFAGASGAPSATPATEADDGLDEAQRADRDRVVEALTACGGNQTRAAAKLGVSRTTLVIKMRAYRIKRPRA